MAGRPPPIGCGILLLAISLIPIPGEARQAQEWDVTEPRGETRTIDFVTDQGTWMSVDVSPDGEWLVFDLLGHVYRVPVKGGEATSLTQESGVAINYQPRISPDGRTIAFVSDRSGQFNLWLMDADGTNLRPVSTDGNVRVSTPEWTPDGEYVIVRRQPGGLGMFHREGGRGIDLLGDGFSSATSPAVSGDGRHLYFDVSTGQSLLGATGGVRQVRRADLRTGEVLRITAGEPNTQIRLSSGGGYVPRPSPDGRYVAFARQIPNGTLNYRGHSFGPRTALVVRNLESGEERVVMDPIESDRAEGGGGEILPGYAWSRDGASIFLTQGGRLRRLDVATGAVNTIPFSAPVRREISEQAFGPFRITDDPFLSVFHRWQTLSPDGQRLAFQAVGRIWIMELPDGVPRRLTPESFEPFEHAPTWSPDGAEVAFTSSDERARGHLWTASVTGGEPRQLSRTEGEYLHPAWEPTGSQILVVRGSGVTAHGRGWMFNPYYDLVLVPHAGGSEQHVTRVSPPSEIGIYGISRRSVVQPHWGVDGRIFFAEDQEEGGVALVSLRPDGVDRRLHLTFPFADEIAPSPDGRWVAFQEGDNVYLTPIPEGGTGRGDPPHIEKRQSDLPVRQLTREGGMFPRWWDTQTLEFGSGNRHFRHHVESLRTDTTAVRLEVSQRIPDGSLGLTGVRIIPLVDGQVLENATLVIRGSRIACVGNCPLDGVDRIIEAPGATVVPGLIDMHAHHHRETREVFGTKNVETEVYLAFGVTTTLDNSMWHRNVFPVAELIRAGSVLGPRTYSTGPPLYAGDSFRQNALTSPEVAAENVRRLQSWGSVSLKQYRQPRRDQRQWVAEAAREHGLMLTAEGGDLEYILGMVMDGHTAWEHPLGYYPIYEDVSRFLGGAEAVYSVTFGVGGGIWNENYWWAESDLFRDDKLLHWMPWRTFIPHARRRPLRPDSDYGFPILAEALKDIMEFGGHGAIGAHGQAHGIGPHWEVWMAASALGPMGALELASREGAYFLGALEDLGTLEPGKLADLLVLNSNPLDDIRNTTDIRYVIQGGIVFDADTLDEVWPEVRPYGSRPWADEDSLRADELPLDHWDRPGGR